MTPLPQGVLHELDAAPIVGAFVTAASGIIAVRPLPRFLSGWGLLKYRPHARMVGFVLLMLNRRSVPQDTAVGI